MDQFIQQPSTLGTDRARTDAFAAYDAGVASDMRAASGRAFDEPNSPHACPSGSSHTAQIKGARTELGREVAGDTLHVDEAEAAAAAAAAQEQASRDDLVARTRIALDLSQSFTMAAWFMQQAAVAVRYGIFEPERLGMAIGASQQWIDRGIQAAGQFGEALLEPHAVPNRDALEDDAAQIRENAKVQLRALAWYAHAHADLLDTSPENVPALLSLGRSLTETYDAANADLHALGVTIRALQAAQHA